MTEKCIWKPEEGLIFSYSCGLDVVEITNQDTVKLIQETSLYRNQMQLVIPKQNVLSD